MSIFSSLKIYAGKWQKTSERNFSSEELNEVREATIVASNYSMSVCFMLSVGQTYLPVSTESEHLVKPGDRLDLRRCKLITLGKQGESDIMRVELTSDSILK